MADWLVRGLGGVAGLVPRSVGLRTYSVPWIARTVRAVLNVCIQPGLRDVLVVSGPLKGARLELDLRREKYLWLGTYEPWVQDAMMQLIKRGMTAWDVGAFIGYHTLLMHRMAGAGRVVAFEPDPVNRARLERNLALNGAGDVVVLAAAAGAEQARSRLIRVRGHPGETKVGLEGSDECEVVCLDSVLGRLPPPGLIKVDVEGRELDVLQGANEVLRIVRPAWLLELHGHGSEAVHVLRAAGYHVSRVGKGVDVPADLPVGGPAHVLAVPA